MSNFLSQLVARSLQQAPLVQPRLPSVFEPIHQTQQPESTAPGTIDESHVPDNRPPSPLATTILAIPPTAKRNSRLPGTDAAPEQSSDPATLKPIRPSPSAQHGGESRPAATTPRSRSATAKPTSVEAHPRPEHPAITPTRATLLKPALSAVQPSPQLPVPGRTVHVTIGRLEVRAVMTEPVTRSKSRDPAPRVKLEEYLRNGGKP